MPAIMIENDEETLIEVVKTDETVESKPEAKIKFRLTIEPILMLLFLGIHIIYLVETNLFEERVCFHTDFGKNKSVNCINMTLAERKIVQPYVADLMMVKNMIDTFVPCITSLFLGSWSDRNGRLPLLLSAVSGIVINCCMYCVFSTIPELPPISLLLCNIPRAISGGIVVISIASFCYIADITDSKTRAFRLGVLHSFISLGKIIASILSPILYRKSVTLALAVSSISTIFGLLYTYCFVNETITIKKGVNNYIFKADLIKDMWQTITKQRIGYLRSIIVLCGVVLTFKLLILSGEHIIEYLYLQNQFSWTLTDYSLFNAYSILLNTILPVMGLYVFSIKLQIPDICLAMAANVLQIIEKVGTAYSSKIWQFYLMNVFGCFVPATRSLVRSQISKIFPSEELGKTNAFLSIVEGFGSFLGPIIYTVVYNTIKNVPNCIFLLSTILSIFCLVLFKTILLLLSKNTPTEDSLIEN